MGIKDNRKLNISFIKKENHLLCSITDNGVGREKSAKINSLRPKKHKSFATSATQKRLDLLNNNSKEKILVEIVDLYEDEFPMGTKVLVNVPIKPFSN